MAKVNVRSQHFTKLDGPKMRVLKSVRIGKDGWLRWEWMPVNDRDRIDCGYSGMSPKCEWFRETKKQFKEYLK